METLLIIAEPPHAGGPTSSLKPLKGPAWRRGLSLARRMGASVHLVGFCHEPLKGLEVEQQTQVRERLLQQRREGLQTLALDAEKDGVSVTVEVVWEKAVAEWIMAHCIQQDYFAVIKTGHRSERLLHTPTDWQLIRQCATPVLLVSEKKWRKGQPVVAALDLHSSNPDKLALNERVMAQAARLAQVLEREIHVVHAVYMPAVLRDLDLVDETAWRRQRLAEIAPRVEDLCSRWQLPRTQVHLKSGPAAKVIKSVCSRVRAELLVIGSSGRRGLQARVVGNTAEQVLEHLYTDVMTVTLPD